MKLIQLDCCGCKGGKKGEPKGTTWTSERGGSICPIYLESFIVFLDPLGKNDESSSVGKIVHDIEGKKASMVKPCFISSKGEEKRLRQVMMDH